MQISEQTDGFLLNAGQYPKAHNIECKLLFIILNTLMKSLDEQCCPVFLIKQEVLEGHID